MGTEYMSNVQYNYCTLKISIKAKFYHETFHFFPFSGVDEENHPMSIILSVLGLASQKKNLMK